MTFTSGHRASHILRSAATVGFAALASASIAAVPVLAQSPPDTAATDSTSLPFPGSFVLDPLLVTATRTPRSASDLSVAINIVGRAELEGRPIRLLTDLLAHEPGILIQQTTAGQGSPFIRGLTGSQILVMVDGVRLNNGTFRQGPSQYLATIDPEIVERLEVVRGASSTLYGSDAIGGVVQVLTRKPADLLAPGERYGGEGTVMYDGATRGGRVRVTGVADAPDVAGGLSVMAGASFSDQGDLRPGGGLPAQAPTGYSQYGGDLRADLILSERWSLDGAVQHFEQNDVPRYDRLVDFRDPTVEGGGVGDNSVYLFGPQRRSLGRVRATGIFERPLLSALDFSLSWQRQEEGRTTRRQSVENGILTPSDTRLFVSDAVNSVAGDLQARVVRDQGRTEITYGAEAWHHRTNSFGWSEDVPTGVRVPQIRLSGTTEVPTGRFPDDSRFSGAAGYVFGDRRLGESLRAQAGVRGSLYWTTTRVGDAFGGDVDSRFGNVSLEGGLVWTAAKGWDLRARVAQAFRAPNIYDLTLVGDVPGGFSLPNPNLDPETSVTVEAGARFTGQGVSLDATIFRLKIDGLLDRVKGAFRGDTLFGPDDSRVFTIQNVGTATVQGVEALLRSRLPRDGSFSLAFHWLHGEADVTRDDTLISEPLSRVPPTTADLRLRWPLGLMERAAWFEYHARVVAAQERLGFRDETDSRIQPGGTPGYQVHSVRGGVTVNGSARITLGLENLFDRLYRVHGSGIDSAGRHLFLRLDVKAFSR